jgi:silicon transporter
MDPLTLFKSIYSVALLIFSLVSVFAMIATRQTNLSDSAHPAVAYIVFCVAILWLTMVEGGQASLVGLAPVNKELYKDSHPISYMSTKLTNEGDNLDRYLLGRQFMVVLVVFCVNMSAAPIGGAEIWGYPQWIKDTFFGFGLAMILITCMIGQLNTQVNASHCMLDYIDNYFAVFTLWVAMAIEFSGLLHASYLVQILVGLAAGKPVESKEDPKTGFTLIFFWARILMSLAILAFCIAVTMEALFTNRTTMWEGVPPGVAVVIFFVLMCVVGMLEGMQIAFFAVAKITKEERGTNFFALKTCDLLYTGEGHNLPGFMVGRQLCVVSCMFFVARVTSVKIGEGESNIFNAPEFLQKFFNTGFLGAIMLTILGSISWQLVAGQFPIAFLSNPVTYILLRICLGLEATGICQGAWVIAAVHRKISGFQRDEVYIGTAEERKKQEVEDSA